MIRKFKLKSTTLEHTAGDVITLEGDWEEIREPIATIGGVDYYLRDTIFLVRDDFSIEETIVTNEHWKPDESVYKYFNSMSAAEQYVNENEPVYPAYWVESLIDSAQQNMRILSIEARCFHNSAPLIDKLKTFKK